MSEKCIETETNEPVENYIDRRTEIQARLNDDDSIEIHIVAGNSLRLNNLISALEPLFKKDPW